MQTRREPAFYVSLFPFSYPCHDDHHRILIAAHGDFPDNVSVACAEMHATYWSGVVTSWPYDFRLAVLVFLDIAVQITIFLTRLSALLLC